MFTTQFVASGWFTSLAGIPWMNDQTPNAADASGIQFDEAEFAEPTAGVPVCVACHQTIPEHYFQINGQILCEPCSEAVKAQLTGGSSFVRFVKAGVYGFGAAVAGFAIYFGVMKLTGLEIGLISILVGYMVGAAIRKGCDSRGGVLYQLMAVGFTYLAIAVSYSALLIPQMIEQIKAEKAAAVQPHNAAPAIDPAKAANGGEKSALDAKPEDPQVADEPLTAGGLAIAIAIIVGFLLALPIIAGFSQPIGLLIVGFALWEAFKMNRKLDVVITGPHNIGPDVDRATAHV